MAMHKTQLQDSFWFSSHLRNQLKDQFTASTRGLLINQTSTQFRNQLKGRFRNHIKSQLSRRLRYSMNSK